MLPGISSPPIATPSQAIGSRTPNAVARSTITEVSARASGAPFGATSQARTASPPNPVGSRLLAKRPIQ